ncbi:chloride channel protein [Pseudacidobacterium ailaaui]|jgi:CIC family chloride channel protein|uniref:chloride channel protein n=1 Tax=Pseudacidobacterium ailaaui TaxID=1382359 RepID=UPI0005D2AE12|nr:chloride channel protein [Pseudacidobacterium ailaaui]
MTISEKATNPDRTVSAFRSHLRDFTADPRMLVLSGLALVLGGAGSVLAYLLLHLIYAATNLFYFHRLSWQFISPAENHLHWLAVLVPVAGGVLIGLMARYGSEKIRGHGMPEAIEAILIHGAKVDGKVAVFKPLSAAIAIGSGGPFGAEGPIIMTAGSVGSLLGQLFKLSDAERTTMLVAGAAAGMTGVFSTPLSAVLLAVELLLFEWRPRSLVPVAVAATTAGVLRRHLLGPGPLFPMSLYNMTVGPRAVAAALLLGVLGGLAALLLSRAVYASEDFFEEHLPVHWMWWPAIGGLVIGLGGLIFPRALGTGYDVIDSLIAGNAAWQLIAGVLIVKSIIWAFSLGSGTSGGILAPLLMIGGALGALVGHGLPFIQVGAWPLVGMAAVLSGAIGCPLTAAALSMELTHNYGLMLPLLAASVAAHAFTVLFQRRSILTERLSRRGYHLSREYSVDPLEIMTVSQVMHSSVVALPSGARIGDVKRWIEDRRPGKPVEAGKTRKGQRLYPVVDENGKLQGIVTRAMLERYVATHPSDSALPWKEAEIAYPDETLRSVAERMAALKIFVLPVIEPGTRKVVGILSLEDMLQARLRSHERETKQERIRKLRLPFRTANIQRVEESMDAAG